MAYRNGREKGVRMCLRSNGAIDDSPLGAMEGIGMRDKKFIANKCHCERWAIRITSNEDEGEMAAAAALCCDDLWRLCCAVCACSRCQLNKFNAERPSCVSRARDDFHAHRLLQSIEINLVRWPRNSFEFRTFIEFHTVREREEKHAPVSHIARCLNTLTNVHRRSRAHNSRAKHFIQ